MPLSAGDVVLSFLGDTTNLDAAFDKIGTEATAKLGPAQAAVSGVDKAFVSAGQSATSAGTKAEVAGTQIATAGDTAAKSMRGAGEQVRVVEELIGVGLPRGVNSVVATLPGLGNAITAVFDASVILFLVDAVYKVAVAISSFKSAQSEAEKETGKLNAELVGLNKQLDDSKRAFEAVGASASEKAAAAVAHLNEVLSQGSAKLVQLQRDVDAARDSLAKSTAFENSGFFKFLGFIVDGAQADRAKSFFAGLAVSVGNFLEVLPQGVIKVKDASDKVTNALTAQQDGAKKVAIDSTNAATEAKTGWVDLSEQIKTQAKQTLDTQQSYIAAWLAVQSAAFQKGSISASQWATDQDTAAKKASDAENKYFDLLISHATDRDQLNAAFAAKFQALFSDVQKAAQGAAEGTSELNKQARELNELAAKDDDVAFMAVQLKNADKAALDFAKSLVTLGQAQQTLQNQQKENSYAAAEAQITQLADLEVITEAQKAQRLKVLYQQEEKDALAQLNDQYAKEAELVESAQRHLAEVQANGTTQQVEEAKVALNKLLADYNLTYAQILGITQQFDNKYKQLDTAVIKSAQSSWDSFFKELTHGSLTAGEAIHALGELTKQGIGESVTAAVSGSESFGQAMEGMLKAALASLAGQAVVKAISDVASAYDMFAQAAAMAANPFTEGLAGGFIAAGNTFLVAAAAWGALGAGAAIGGAAIPSGSGSGGSGGSSSNSGSPISTSPAGQTQQQPKQTVNIQQLAGGGHITQPTLAMIGEMNQPEAVLPLGSNHAAMDMIADKIAARMGNNGGGVTVVMQQGKGIIMGTKDQVAKQVAKDVSRAVKKGTATLHSSSTGRVIRKSS